MRSSLVVLALVLAGAACDDGEPGANMCSSADQQVVGDEMALTEASAPSLAGDHVVLLAGAPASAQVVDACSGEIQSFAAEDLSGAFALTGEAGALALGHRQPSGEVLLLDRLDEPGIDEPRQIARLDPNQSGWYRWPEGLLLWSGPLLRDEPGVSQVFWYPGPAGPEHPATLLADDVVWLARGGPDVFVARTTRGSLLHLHAGAADVVHPQVRRAGLAPGGAQVVWIDDAGSMTLHTFATDSSLDLVAAQITLRSAGPEPDAWRWTDDVLAVVDEDGVVFATHDREEGTRLANPPSHQTARADVAGDLLLLTVAVAPERVELAFDPRTGVSFEWYRGPDVALTPLRADDGVRYHAEGQLWQARPGEANTLLQAEASLDSVALADGRTVMALIDPDETNRLVLLDETGALAMPLADGVTRWSVTADDPPRLVYAVADEPMAGVWVTPLATR